MYALIFNGKRPMLHFTERRIEAHICICFVAYKVYSNLLQQLPLSYSDKKKT